MKHLLQVTSAWIAIAILFPLYGVAEEEKVHFTAQTSEGIEVTFTVISEEDKTCMVGFDHWDNAISDVSITEITIPETVEGYKVIKIGKGAFDYSYDKLTTVTLPSSIIEIGEYAFYDCRKLKTINFPEGLITIGAWSFQECVNLENVSLPNSLLSIERNAFCRCSSLSSIHIPAAVNYIGWVAFAGCTAMRSMTVDANNAVYDSRNNCNGIIETGSNKIISSCSTTVVPSSVTAYGPCAFALSEKTSHTVPRHISLIEIGAFAGCDKLLSIKVDEGNSIYDSRDNCNAIIETATDKLISGCINTIIPDGITSIGEGAFANLSILEGIKLPNTIVSIENYAFSDCYGLKRITIPNSVLNIGDEAFAWCDSLEKVKLSNSLEKIGAGAFINTSIKNITLPKTLKSIGEEAFLCCYSLKTIYSEIEDPFEINKNVFSYNTFDRVSLYVPKGAKEHYNKVEAWKYFDPKVLSEGDVFTFDLDDDTEMYFTVISDDNKTCVVGRGPCSGDRGKVAIDNLTQEVITIPATARGFKVTGIGSYAFHGCTGLKELVVPEFIDSIGNRAYQDCTSLTNITFPSSLKHIGQYAFANCTGLNSVTTHINIPFNLDETAFMMDNSNYNKYIIYNVVKLFVPEERLEIYKHTNGWKLFANIYPSNPSSIVAHFQQTTDPVMWFSLDGKNYDKHKRGLNIVRMSDGTTRKVVRE